MFLFEGFIVMFVCATPMALILIINRDKYELPRVIFYLSLGVLLSATLIIIGGVGALL